MYIRSRHHPVWYAGASRVPLNGGYLYPRWHGSPLLHRVDVAVPARIAGCSEIVLCTPPNEEGEIHPAILYAAAQTGVTRILPLAAYRA